MVVGRQPFCCACCSRERQLWDTQRKRSKLQLLQAAASFSLKERGGGGEHGWCRSDCSCAGFLTQTGFWEGGFGGVLGWPPHLWGPFKVILRLIFAEGFPSHSAEPERTVCILEFIVWALWSVLISPYPVVFVIYKLEGMMMESNSDWIGILWSCFQMFCWSLWSPESISVLFSTFDCNFYSLSFSLPSATCCWGLTLCNVLVRVLDTETTFLFKHKTTDKASFPPCRKPPINGEGNEPYMCTYVWMR